MMSIKRAYVKEITYRDADIIKFKIQDQDKLYDCINYNRMTGEAEVNDEVLINTTAVELGLGTGGYHFVVANLSKDGISNIGDGHIMKLRYTPMQISCLAAEAQESPHHEVFNTFESLDSLPVIVGTLHSMLAPITLALKNLSGKQRIVYVMTEGGALPIWMSEAVRSLRGNGLLHGTVTYGNAFGGDLECINVYTALIAAKEILKADAVIVCMGPGIAGTDTSYGFSGIEQSQILDVVSKLGGKAIAVPRISFTDSRCRHYGLSHHTRMTLGKLGFTRACIALPELEADKASLIRNQLESSGIITRHDISYWKWGGLEPIFEKEEGLLLKMGKGFNQDNEYFITCGLSAMLSV